VGMVWFAWATPEGLYSECQHFAGDRAAVRSATVAHSVGRLIALLPPAA